MKACAFPSALSCGDVNQRFVQVILPIRHLVGVSVIRSPVWHHSACVHLTLFHLIMAPEHKRGDASKAEYAKEKPKSASSK